MPPTHVALLRGINLAGKRSVKMADLCALFTKLGFTDVKSLLNSGNVVFAAKGRTTAQIEKVLEEATAKHLGIETDYMVRTAAEWRAIIAANPFPREAKTDPARLVAGVLKTTPPKGAEQALNDAIVGREVARVIGSVAYIYFPDGQGRSKLTPAVTDRSLGTRGTARNWNTVLKIGALL